MLQLLTFYRTLFQASNGSERSISTFLPTAYGRLHSIVQEVLHDIFASLASYNMSPSLYYSHTVCCAVRGHLVNVKLTLSVIRTVSHGHSYGQRLKGTRS